MPINPTVLYIFTYCYNFYKNWLCKSKIAVAQLLSYWHNPLSWWGTEIHCDMKQCFQKQKTTCAKDICFSLFLDVVNIHILVINNCKNLWYCKIYYEKIRPPYCWNLPWCHVFWCSVHIVILAWMIILRKWIRKSLVIFLLVAMVYGCK